MLTALAATREEVIAKLKEDPYTKANVWDWEKIQVLPVRTPTKPRPHPRWALVSLVMCWRL